jgi:hypothetical protein
VDSAGHTVLELEVHLGDRVLSEDGGLRDITCKASIVSSIVSCGLGLIRSLMESGIL